MVKKSCKLVRNISNYKINKRQTSMPILSKAINPSYIGSTKTR